VTPSLQSGQPIERELSGGESHTFQITLSAGQFVRFVLDQRAINGALILTAPDGKQLAVVDLTRIGQLESLSMEVAGSGSYRLTVRGGGGAGVHGSYRLEAAVKAAATAQDRKRIAAEALAMEAEGPSSRGKTRQQVIEKLEQALPLWRELGEQSSIAWSLSNIGDAYHLLGQSEKAIEYDEQALAIYRAAKNRAGEGVLIALGNAYNRLNQTEKAIEYFEQTLPIYREVRDRDGEAGVFNNLGDVYQTLGQSEKAIQSLEQALAILRETKNRRTEAAVLNNLGNVYNQMHRTEKAVEYHERALMMAQEIQDKGFEARASYNLGTELLALDRFEKAIEYLERALAIAVEVKERRGEGIVSSGLGEAYASHNQPEKAVQYYQRALAIEREVKDRNSEGNALAGLGEVQRKLGRTDQAAETLTQAVTLLRAVGARDLEVPALFDLALTERTRGNLPKARAVMEDNLRIAESMRSDLVGPESRASFLASVQNSYQLYIDLLMRQHVAEPKAGLDALAFGVSERQRARSLLDLLTEAHADVSQGVDAALLERERKLAKQLNDKAQTEAKTPEQAAALKQEISQLENDYERAQAAIRKSSPHYGALAQPQPLSLKEIQQQVLDNDTLLLEYSLGDERSYLWAITNNSVTTHELPKREEIEKTSRQVYELLTTRSINKRGEAPAQRSERIARAETKLTTAAQELSQMLLAPVAAELGNKRLVIVADGALQYIPFAMLPEPVVSGQLSVVSEKKHANPQSAIRNPQSPAPLIVGHEVVSLPSASALAIQRTELAGRQLAPKMLAVIADPVFDRTDARLTKPVTETGEKSQTSTIGFDDARSIEHLAENSGDKSGVATRLVIPRLPFTRQEGEQLLALTPKESSLRAMDFNASRATVLDPALGQYRYVHFATHGLLDSERPGLSALVLSMVDAQGKAQDGFLRANDIYNLKLPAELVVLSACQTGLGKEIKGEGLEGLTRGFMYAGAARVVVSLWSVNDKATAELMTKFYEKMLKQGERPAAALRAAQVEMWKQKQWQSPYYWAAFTLQGEWR
jgi:CHAT domain-containing protein/tetratricopeptide (TPR) repeat protein